MSGSGVLDSALVADEVVGFAAFVVDGFPLFHWSGSVVGVDDFQPIFARMV